MNGIWKCCLLLSMIFCLSGCQSGENDSKGSSITTQSPGKTTVSTSEVESGEETEKNQPNLNITYENPVGDPNTETYVVELKGFLDGFGILNQRIGETYGKLMEYPDSNKAISDYLIDLNDLVKLLRSSEGLLPPEVLFSMNSEFVISSLEMADRFEEVGALMGDGFSVETPEELVEFETLTAEIIRVTEGFMSVSFSLLFTMEQMDLI